MDSNKNPKLIEQIGLLNLENPNIRDHQTDNDDEDDKEYVRNKSKESINANLSDSFLRSSLSSSSSALSQINEPKFIHRSLNQVKVLTQKCKIPSPKIKSTMLITDKSSIFKQIKR